MEQGRSDLDGRPGTTALQRGGVCKLKEGGESLSGFSFFLLQDPSLVPPWGSSRDRALPWPSVCLCGQ